MSERITPISDLERILLNNIRIARLNANLQQRDAAKKIGVKENYVSRLESGERKMTAVAFYELCELYKVNMYDMFDSEYAINNPQPTADRISKIMKNQIRLDEKKTHKKQLKI